MAARTRLNKTEVSRVKVPIAEAGNAKPRILIADDHTIVGEALATLLAPEFEVVGRVGDGRALLDAAVKLKPAVVILDLTMPSLNGMDAGRRLKGLLPDTRIIVLTANEDPDLATAVLDSWGSGFLLKKEAASALIKAVSRVLAEQPKALNVANPGANENRTRANWLKSSKALTVRQREVLQLLAEGCTMKEAAKVLGLTARTVAFHKYKIMEEFGIKNNSDLLWLAIREHVIPPP